MPRVLVALLLLLALAPVAQAKVTIRTMSDRADLISGGNARVVIRPAGVRVRLNGHRAHGLVKRGHKLTGVLTGLRNGRNVLRAGHRQLVITNHPNGGPVFGGPQIQPWKCEDGALDKQCNKPAKFTYVYKSTDATKKGMQPYDPKSPPDDLATTTTENGKTVPFVVRVETGYMDRDQYKVATLFDPAKPWTPTRAQATFNHKLLITHGASCDVDYEPGGAPSVTSYNPADLLGLPVATPSAEATDSVEYALGRGFVVMSTALDNSGHDCDVVDQAESLVMAKEHVVEAYGTLKYTIGTGCSGGSLAQQWIANAYPGIYQGILPTCSFPDTWSSATQVMDYHLLRAYFENTSAQGTPWSPSQWGDVEGNLLPVDAIVSDIGFFNAIVPTHGCGGISDAQRYNPQSNPGGVRCAISDLAINVFGPRVKSVWGTTEKKLGHGFAGIAVDNVGVQYGLSSLKSGAITADQFVDLNQKIGGLDVNISPTANRIAADQPALARAYRSGMINETNNLDRTAIIDCRGPDPGAAHDSYRAFAVRACLDREHGGHGNQLIWEGSAPIVGDTQCAYNSLKAMDTWLAAIRKDRSATPLAKKIVADKPKDETDECYTGGGQLLTHDLCGDAIVPVYGTPRTVAGDAITTDDNKCQLKPLTATTDGVTFTDAQLATLKKAFPTGVCDFSKPGVDQQPTVPWLRYGSAKHVRYGGVRMRRAPRAHRIRH